MPLALIADDEPHLARHLQQQLTLLWPELTCLPLARNGPEAAAAIAEHQPDLAFLDIRMPGSTGLEVAQGIEGRTRVVFVTAYDEHALQAFEAEMRPITSTIILTNRSAGPDKILDVVEERCGGQFDRIEEVIARSELSEHAANYKRIAGFGIRETNEKPRTIAEGARFAMPPGTPPSGATAAAPA